MSFLRFLAPSAAVPALPPEIAFLTAEGVDAALLRQAAALAEASGTDAATAADMMTSALERDGTDNISLVLIR